MLAEKVSLSIESDSLIPSTKKNWNVIGIFLQHDGNHAVHLIVILDTNLHMSQITNKNKAKVVIESTLQCIETQLLPQLNTLQKHYVSMYMCANKFWEDPMSIRIDNTRVIRYEYVNYYLVPIKSVTANITGDVFGKAANRATSDDIPLRTYRK